MLCLSEHVLSSNVSNVNVINIFLSVKRLCAMAFFTCVQVYILPTRKLWGVCCVLALKNTLNTNTPKVLYLRKGHKNCLFQSVILT